MAKNRKVDDLEARKRILVAQIDLQRHMLHGDLHEASVSLTPKAMARRAFAGVQPWIAGLGFATRFFGFGRKGEKGRGGPPPPARGFPWRTLVASVAVVVLVSTLLASRRRAC